MKKLLSLLLVLLCGLTLVACGSDKGTDESDWQASLLKDNTIIVGISPDYPPFESIDTKTQEIMGYDPDMINEVVSIINQKYGTNLSVELKALEFSTIVGAMQANQIDLGVSGFTYDPERNCLFSTPYLNSKQVIITRKDTGITSAADLVNKKVGAQLGSTGAKAAKEIEGADVKELGEYTVMFQTLKAGQLDAIVCDEAVAENYVKEMDLYKCEEALVDESMSIIANNSRTALMDVVNEAVEVYLTSDKAQELKVKWELVSK